jgi:hypothetical protein
MRSLIGAFCLLAALSPVATPADLPSAETLLQHYVERSGGADAWAKARNSRTTGTVEIAGRSITGTVEVVEEGVKSLTAIDLAGIGKIEQGFDGETAWERNAIQGARLIDGDEKNALKRSSAFALANSWKDEYSGARTLGEENLDGKPAWKVEMTPKEGKPETFYFDKESSLLVRMSAVVTTPLGDIAADVTLSDYRAVDGIQTPFTMTQGAMGQTIVMHFDKIVYNATLPKDQFALPAEVQALVAKRKKQ